MLLLRNLNMVKSDSSASGHLNLLRFVAALTVFIYHFTRDGFLNFSISHHSVLFAPFIWLYDMWTYCGYQAVMVFFVLSGYFISSSVLKLMVNNSWSWKFYLTNRLTRLWVVLLPALFLTLFWNSVQVHFVGNELLAFWTHNPPNPNLAHSIGLPAFLGNLFFLQDIFVSVYGNNGPLWSLSFEFWYYILFPSILLVFFAKRRIAKAGYILILAALAFLLPGIIWRYFLVWLLGAVVAVTKPLVMEKRMWRRFLILITGSAALASTQTYRLLHLQVVGWGSTNFGFDMLVGILFATVVYIIVSFHNTPATSNYRRRVFAQLAGFSYTLYLVHYPLVDLYNALRHVHVIQDIKVGHLLDLAFVISVLLYAWTIAQFTEARTAQIRNWILQRTRRTNTALNLSNR